jgi:hypothetical protein
MNCDRCGTMIESGEDREHGAQTLCEDCYMDAISPVRTCDPWAVHSAKSLEKHSGGVSTLTALQSEIMRILEETGGLERLELLQRLDGKLTLPQLEREFAALRHMEKARAEKRGPKVVLRLW